MCKKEAEQLHLVKIIWASRVPDPLILLSDQFIIPPTQDTLLGVGSSSIPKEVIWLIFKELKTAMVLDIEIQAALINSMIRKHTQHESHDLLLKRWKWNYYLFFYLSSSPVFQGLFVWVFNFRVCLGSCFMLFSAAITARYLPGKEAMIHSHLMTPEGKPLGILAIIARQELGAYNSKLVFLHLLTQTRILQFSFPLFKKCCLLHDTGVATQVAQRTENVKDL